VVAATAACEEVKSSKKWKKILELVLLFGNYMNAGSKKERSLGFEMNFLTKVNSDVIQPLYITLFHHIPFYTTTYIIYIMIYRCI